MAVGEALEELTWARAECLRERRAGRVAMSTRGMRADPEVALAMRRFFKVRDRMRTGMGMDRAGGGGHWRESRVEIPGERHCGREEG